TKDPGRAGGLAAFRSDRGRLGRGPILAARRESTQAGGDGEPRSPRRAGRSLSRLATSAVRERFERKTHPLGGCVFGRIRKGRRPTAQRPLTATRSTVAAG